MSTLELEHIKHASSATNNLSVASDGSIAPVTMKGSGATLNIDSTSGNANAIFKLNGTTTASIEVGGGNSLYLTANNSAGAIHLRNSATTNMTIFSDGRIDMPNQIGALFQGNDGAWATINAGNVIARTFQTTGGSGSYGHNSITYNSTNGRFTFSRAGKYWISGHFYCSRSADQDMRIVLRKNGGGQAFHHHDFPSTSTTFTVVSQAALNISANDYIDFYTPYQVDNYSGGEHTYVSIFKVA